MVVDDMVNYLKKENPKFFEAESAAIITAMMSRYKAKVKEESEFAGETFEQHCAYNGLYAIRDHYVGNDPTFFFATA